MNSGSICAPSPRRSIRPAFADDSSETIRYLTGGVLLRLNRDTQKLEPELATLWTVSTDGRTITFLAAHGDLFLRRHAVYRPGREVHDGPVDESGAAFSRPRTRSARARAKSITHRCRARQSRPSTSPLRWPDSTSLFDQVAIVSSQSPNKELAVLGPYYVSDYKPGSYVYLRKNPNYWKHDAARVGSCRTSVP